jgi:hypothetical protein
MIPTHIQALKKARAQETRYHNIVEKTAGCVFFSVPHRAADIAHWVRNSATFTEAPKGHRSRRLGWGVSKSSEEWEKIEKIGCDFADSIPNIQIGTVYETQQTKGKVVSLYALSSSCVDESLLTKIGCR